MHGLMRYKFTFWVLSHPKHTKKTSSNMLRRPTNLCLWTGPGRYSNYLDWYIPKTITLTGGGGDGDVRGVGSPMSWRFYTGQPVQCLQQKVFVARFWPGEFWSHSNRRLEVCFIKLIECQAWGFACKPQGGAVSAECYRALGEHPVFPDTKLLSENCRQCGSSVVLRAFAFHTRNQSSITDDDFFFGGIFVFLLLSMQTNL